VLTKEAHHVLNASAFGKAYRKKTTVVFVAIPATEADSYLAVFPQKTHRIISEGRGITLSQL